MYNTSNSYKSKIYLPSTKHLLRVFINNIEVNLKYILDIKISHFLFADEVFSLGSTPSKSVELKLYKDAVPNSISSIYISSGITGEEIPIGYFNLESISKDNDYTVTLKLLDNMIKFESNYDGSQLTYPATLKQVLQDICTKKGVELRFYFFFKPKQTNCSI